MAKRAKVFYDGILAAYLSETDEGYLLQYVDNYISAQGNKPISLILPVQKEPYKSNVLFPFFDGLIPEGWLLDIAVDYWKLKANDRFELLLATCHDTIGAVTIEPE